MVDLTDLDLSFNFLTAFPYEEGNMPSLVNLDIRGNPILSLPKFIIKTNLEIIFLEWDHVLKEESYLKGSNEPKNIPFIEEYLPPSFAIPITNIKSAFKK